jgi:hypothetical protein
MITLSMTRKTAFSLPTSGLGLLTCLLFFTLTSGARAQLGNEYVDPTANSAGPTSISGMHGCDGPHLMTGIHVNNNWLLCLGVGSSAGGDIFRYPDYNTSMTVDGLSMHTCPRGFAMKGIHVDSNILLCQGANVDWSTLYGDTGTIRSGMHACQPGYVMVGIHVDRNVLACARVGN